jgi:hypothetical protein
MMGGDWSRTRRKDDSVLRLRERKGEVAERWRDLEQAWRKVGSTEKPIMGGVGEQNGEQISGVEVGTHFDRCDLPVFLVFIAVLRSLLALS